MVGVFGLDDAQGTSHIPWDAKSLPKRSDTKGAEKERPTSNVQRPTKRLSLRLAWSSSSIHRVPASPCQAVWFPTSLLHCALTPEMVVGFTADGSLDTGFGTGGMATWDSGGEDYGRDVMLQLHCALTPEMNTGGRFHQ